MSDLVTNIAQTGDPKKVSDIGGFLGNRFLINIENRQKDKALSEYYIGLFEKKNHSDWFWLGEQLGKWLHGATYSALTTSDDALLKLIEDYIDRLEKQQESTGHLCITASNRVKPVRGMELYENYFTIFGLVTVFQLLGNEKALAIAVKLADFYLRIYGDQPGQYPMTWDAPGTGHEDHYGTEGTLIIHPIMALYHVTKDQRYLDWCEMIISHWDEWASKPTIGKRFIGQGTKYYTNLLGVANATTELYEFHPTFIHAHSLHMNVLGLCEAYRATGNQTYFDIVKAVVDNIANKHLSVTGGMSKDEMYKNPNEYYTSSNVEVCPQASWIWLCQLMYQFTGQAIYFDYIERTTYNHFLAAQLGDGTNWHYLTPYGGRAQKPYTPNCCNGIGSMFLSILPSLTFGKRADGIDILLFSNATFEDETVKIKQTTDFPTSEDVKIEIFTEQKKRFALRIRKPEWSIKYQILLNGKPIDAEIVNGFLEITRDWENNDTVSLKLDLQVKSLVSGERGCLTRGPIAYALFINSQQAGTLNTIHEVKIDMTSIPKEIQTPNGLLGPTFKVHGKRISRRAPMFYNPKTCDELPKEEVLDIILSPFCNQGTIGGEYQVFYNVF